MPNDKQKIHGTISRGEENILALETIEKGYTKAVRIWMLVKLGCEYKTVGTGGSLGKSDKKFTIEKER